MAKTVHPSKFAEWRGLDRISSTVHEMRCIFREISKDDFGLDGEIEVVVPKQGGQGFETTGGIIKVQAKSGASYVKQDSPTQFVTPVDKADLEGWYTSTFPVAFIVYHPADDALYWKEVKSYVRTTPAVFQGPFHIAFDKAADRFTPASTDALRGAANVVQPRISFQESERLYSNLFPVKRLPRMLTSAATTLKTTAAVRQAVTGFVAPFTLVNSRLYTLADLRDRRVGLREACDVRQVRDVAVEKWLHDADRRSDMVFLLNQLLGSQLRRLGLRYAGGGFRRNYFPRRDAEGTEFKRAWLNVRTGRTLSPGRITAKRYQYGRDEFWRHTAANISFREFGSRWYLQVIPKYFFTSDGEVPYDDDKVGPYSTRIKAVERNYHVLNQVLFWADVLAGGRQSIEFQLDGRSIVTIAKEPLTGIAAFAIPYDPAIYEEPEEAAQMDLFGTPDAGAGADTDDESEEVPDEYLD
jgi:hypothetical protein